MHSFDKYHEALSMQRHYDSLSLAAITAMATIVGGTPIMYKTLAFPAAGLVFFAAIPLLYCAMKIYEGCDVHAAFALKVAGLYEKAESSASHLMLNDQAFYGPADAFTKRDQYGLQGQAGGRIHTMVQRFFKVASAVFFVLGCTSVYIDNKPNLAPTNSKIEEGRLKTEAKSTLGLSRSPGSGSGS